jgi:hypothetical protein
MIDAWERERPAGSFFCSLLPSEHAKSIFSFEKVIARKCGRILNAPGEIRTHGLRIRNPALYPPELRGHIGEIRIEIQEFRATALPFFLTHPRSKVNKKSTRHLRPCCICRIVILLAIDQPGLGGQFG